MTSIFVDLGVEPWRPSPTSTEVAQLDFYNIPLAGILQDVSIESTQTYLYVCAAGEENDTNIWLYAPISDSERLILESSSEQSLVGNLRRALQNKMLVAALAQDWRIVSTAEVDAGSEVPAVIVNRVARRLLAKWTHTASNLETIVQASADTSKREDFALA